MIHKNKHEKSTANNKQAGFSGLEILICVVVVGLIAAVGVVVASHHSSKTVDAALSKTSHTGNTAAPLSSGSSQSSTLSTQSTGSTTATPSTSTSSKTNTSTTPSTKKTTSSSGSSGSSTPASCSPQAQLAALTAVVSGLYNGVSAQVTASPVTVAGPITNATAQPLLFSCDGTTYFAYTQENKPNFNTTPAQTAGTMAIIVATAHGESLTSAYLDKLGNLTDPAFQLVGYSTGGD